MQKNGPEMLFFTTFLVVGLMFLTGGIMFCTTFFNHNNDVETTAIITNIKSSRDINGQINYKVYVLYEVDGVQYESVLSNYSSRYNEGKKIKIYYDKNDPRIIQVKSLNLFLLFFSGFGAMFSCIGGIGLFARFNKSIRDKHLKQKGTRINAAYVKVDVNSRYAVNGRNPYNIVCEWIDPTDNIKYIFKSNNIWIDPTVVINEKNITTFPVYIDSNNKNKYVVDIDELDKYAEYLK